MLPSLIINLLLALSQGLKAFDIVFVLTGGGPNAAYGVILFIITAIAGLLVLRIKDNSDD